MGMERERQQNDCQFADEGRALERGAQQNISPTARLLSGRARRRPWLRRRQRLRLLPVRRQAHRRRPCSSRRPRKQRLSHR